MVAPRKEQFKKIAICILAHTDFDNLERLIVALDSDYFDIYIHIDAKCGEINSTQFSSLARHSSVMVINERVSVHWGDYSVVRAMLLLYRKVLESDSSYAKIALISGLDYPILSNQDIYSKLSGSKELICGSKLDNRSAKFRVMTYHAMSAPRAIRYVARTFSKYLHIYKQNFVVVDGAKLPIWFACQWTALTPNFVEYLLDCMDRNPSIRKYFSTSYAPDELLIPTLLFNSSFKNRAAGTLNDGGGQHHYNEYPVMHYLNYDPVIETFDSPSFEKIVASGKCFVRKVRTGVSDELIERINKWREVSTLASDLRD